MQENHSFDNYFGTYPGADGIPAGTCMPVGKRARPCIPPFRLGGRPVPDLSHDLRIHRMQYARGRMDGFVRAASVDRQTVDRSVMGYYDDRDLPFYWNVTIIFHLLLYFISNFIYIINYLFATLTSSYFNNIGHFFTNLTVCREYFYGMMLFLKCTLIQSIIVVSS